MSEPHDLTTPYSKNLITSSSSNTIKRIKQLLTNRKKRLALGSTVVEGPRSVKDLLRSTRTRHLVQQVLISQEEWHVWYPEIEKCFMSTSSPSRREEFPQILPVADAVLTGLVDTVTPQGVLAVVQIPDPMEMLRLIQDDSTVSSPSSPPLYLVLDALSDPGNMGTLLRSAVAVGVQAVLMLPGTTDPWSPKALRSSMGCAFSLPLISCASWEHALEILAQEPLHCGSNRIWAATMLENVDKNANLSTCYYHVDWAFSSRPRTHEGKNGDDTTTAASALIIGNEGNGLSDVVRQAALQGTIGTTYVPMLESSVESLNAGVCGSIIMFEYLRQCQQQEPEKRGEGND